MIIFEDLFKQKKFPKWFSSHPIFNKVKTAKKVFPSIGLPNFEEPFQMDNSGPAKDAAKHLVKVIGQKISSRIDGIEKFVSSKPDMGNERKAKAALAISLLNAMKRLMEDRPKFIREENGRFTIKLPANIILDGQDRTIYREGESLFRVYNKLNTVLADGKFAKLTKLEDLEPFKTFSTENIPNNEFKIVFSSDGVDGAWDIATMSQRGIQSCQSWDGEYRHCTIGSVIDPFVSIMYLTSGAKSKMIRRCIVRFVIDDKESKPYLLIDNMYPSNDTRIINRFKNLLKEKTGGKFDVEYANNMEKKSLQHTYMPLTVIRKLLKDTDVGGEETSPADHLSSIQSYQDIRLVDKISNKNDKVSILFDKNYKKKINAFTNNFVGVMKNAIKSTDIEAFSDVLKPVVSKLQGNWDYSHNISIFGTTIARAIIKSVDKDQYIDSNLVMRRIYSSYLNNKSKIFDEVKSKIIGQINGHFKQKRKLQAEHFISMMNALAPKIDVAMKTQLKELFSKTDIAQPLPLP